MKRIFLITSLLFSLIGYSQITNITGDYQRMVKTATTATSLNATDSFYIRRNGSNNVLYSTPLSSLSSILGITADNGLTANTSTNVQLGSATQGLATLLHNSYITGDGFFLQVDGGNATNALRGVNSSGGAGVYGSSASGYGVQGVGVIGVYGYSTTDDGGTFASQPSTTNTVHTVLRVQRYSSGTAANGMGAEIKFELSTPVTGRYSNGLISKWTDATDATRTSQFIITGIDAATTRTLMTASGNGAIVMPGEGNPTTVLTVTNPSGFLGISTTASSKGMISTGGVVGVESNSDGIPVWGINTSSTTNAVVEGLILEKSGVTGAAGLGISIEYELPNSAQDPIFSNVLQSTWVTATAGSETSQFKIKGRLSGGSLVDVATFNSDGSMQLTPITATAASAITPAEGMILFVSNTNGTFTSIGLWDYENGAWHKL